MPTQARTRFSPRALVFFSLLLRAGRLAAQATPEEKPGADLFVMPREALIREKPALNGRILARLPAGTRLRLLQGGERFLQAEVVTAAQPGIPAGFIAREVTSVFPAGLEATRDLVTIGRTLARSETYRRLAVAFLWRASQRLDEAGTPDPVVELLLGESAEALAAAGGPFPPGMAVEIGPPDHGDPGRPVYRGEAFARVLELTAKDSSGVHTGLRDRALAGLSRARYPQTSNSMRGLWEETAAWLQLTESASDPAVVASAGARLGVASLTLGRYLLALGDLDAMDKLEKRIRAAGGRMLAIVPNRAHGRRLVARAAILRAMRGDGSRSFPQEARVRNGPVEHVARIEGKLGGLTLVVASGAGATREPVRRTAATPILPVPGSLRMSPDGKSAAWVEVIAPSALVPVMAAVTREEPAREVAFLADGRPLRDRSLLHVIGAVSGYSSDGSRLGLSIDAWNETPGPSPRLSVVSVATGELLFETSKDFRGYMRLIQ